MSLISRKLLTPDEVLKIESPYLIVMIAGKPPALLTVPDISQMHFKKLNGMGTEPQHRPHQKNCTTKRQARNAIEDKQGKNEESD